MPFAEVNINNNNNNKNTLTHTEKNKTNKLNDSSLEKYSSRLQKYNIEFKIPDNCNNKNKKINK